MLSYFTKVKMCQPRPLRAVDRSGFGRFQPACVRFEGDRSCDAQVGQPFEVPTDALELQFQPVGFTAHIPHPPVTRAPLPPPKHFLNLTADRTEQSVYSQGRR